ncbi:hypothetical protein HDV00_012817 [Rhizophlyctis rosea]|nr:hypothetical protein HDV00_012817 [Rhizophlyctis rosea]
MSTPMNIDSPDVEEIEEFTSEEGSEEGDDEPVRVSDTNAEMISSLNKIEQLVTTSLIAASKAIDGLASADDTAKAQEDFKKRCSIFFAILADIHKVVRGVILEMHASGIITTRGSIPYDANVAGEEKDFEIAAKSVSLVLANVRAALRDAQSSVPQLHAELQTT